MYLRLSIFFYQEIVWLLYYIQTGERNAVRIINLHVQLSSLYSRLFPILKCVWYIIKRL